MSECVCWGGGFTELVETGDSKNVRGKRGRWKDDDQSVKEGERKEEERL